MPTIATRALPLQGLTSVAAKVLFLASSGSQAEVTLVSSRPHEKVAFTAGDDYYSQELHGPYQLFDIGDFELEDGGKIRNCKLAYATFGRLSPQRETMRFSS
jgi:hypothetical protein